MWIQHTAVVCEEDPESVLWADVDGVLRVVTDVADRGIARALAAEGQMSAVAAAMFC